MPKVILEFDPELDSVDVIEAFKTQALLIAKAEKLTRVLYDFDNYLRSKIRYSPDGTPEEILDTVQQVRTELYDIMEAAGVLDVVFDV